ncbi:hypothetical protein K1719_014893 [Acacia pycnantha]|nr:hypothetical protein K1719_014893 [Acacia pycnantha]
MNSNPNQQVIVREVWASNLFSELPLIHSTIPYFSFASFDTEFPGTIIIPNVDKHIYPMLSPTTNYSFMKINVDVLNIIQLGLTLSDSNGNLPKFGTQNGHIWQFNFSDFDVERDYQKVESGLLFNSHLTWVTFHSSYDFGFLIKLVIGRQLPPNVHEFKHLVAQFFGPKTYDMKHIIKFCNGLCGGLERVAMLLNVNRVVGNSHQAGSDSLLILKTFMKLKDVYFNEHRLLEKFQGILYSLEVNTMLPTIPEPQYPLLHIPTSTFIGHHLVPVLPHY